MSKAIQTGKPRYQERDFYPVLRLHKEDIENEGFNPAKLSRAEMQGFATDLGDVLLEGGDWHLGIEALAEKYGVPKKVD